MTTRLYCRECGWHSEFHRKRSARRAAARHHCASAPLAEMHPHWWARLWTALWTTRRAETIEAATSTLPKPNGGDGALLDAHGNRIQWAALAAHHAETTRRARRAMVELVRAGYQVGPPPYGYRALRVRVTDQTGRSRLRAVLVPDWRTAGVVSAIFGWRADHGLGFADIAKRLNADARQYPPPAQTGRWTAKTVRRIVTNPKYVGRQVWARTVAGRPTPVEHWVSSGPNAHEPLVDPRTFQRAQPRNGEPPRDVVDPADDARTSAA